MRVIHTADWHLGQRFFQYDRAQEHQRFLDWLLDFMKTEGADILIVSGDIFDTATPPNYALKQYYDFLKEVRTTTCRHIIITGGNHDSPAVLNAPKEVLKEMDVHVIGCAEKNDEGEIDFEKEKIVLRDQNGEIEAVIAAVPFLRDRDLRFSVAGESYEDRAMAVKKGIESHYTELAEMVSDYSKSGIPVLATGHLYAAGGEASDSERDIHIGNLGQVSATAFPDLFDYVALGHLHRPQRIGGSDRVRYSGSPIPLSFSERNDTKEIVILNIENKVVELERIKVPVSRQLLRFRGNIEQLEKNFKTLDDSAWELCAWAEAVVEYEKGVEADPMARTRLLEAIEGKNIELLKISNQLDLRNDNEEIDSNESLDELSEMEIFKKRCVSKGYSDEKTEDLEKTFTELLEWMRVEATV
ncbi:nuclease SbcCD subunit D [Fulvitalea axinellae]|uniref:Nuclease SbcCD subunit D n=1 Tax=Fulvitalea axinellae TaxID=1182444 RepID=A0AAU9CIL5_9BACT|nr:nuclease SbcCD subunit D [Fulvitalea axinellae]